MHEKYPYRFNVRKIVDMLGGIQATKSILFEAGCNIRPKTVTKWMERGNLPPDAFAVIIRHMAAEGRDICWSDYIERTPRGQEE